MELVKTLAAFFSARGVAEKVNGSVNFDPFKRILKRGKDFSNYAETATKIIEAAAAMPNFRVLAVDGVMLNNAGSFIRTGIRFLPRLG